MFEYLIYQGEKKGRGWLTTGFSKYGYELNVVKL
jgi:hypothetical protein